MQGIFNCPGNPNDHCWWFKREIQDLRKNVRYDSTTAVYIDVIPGTKDVDADAHSLLARLKEDKIPAKYTGYTELWVLSLSVPIYPTFCLAVCPSVNLSVHLSVCLSDYLFVWFHLFVVQFVHLLVCLTIYTSYSVCTVWQLSVCLYVLCLPIYPHLFGHLCTHLSIHLSVHLTNLPTD